MKLNHALLYTSLALPLLGCPSDPEPGSDTSDTGGSSSSSGPAPGSTSTGGEESTSTAAAESSSSTTAVAEGSTGTTAAEESSGTTGPGGALPDIDMTVVFDDTMRARLTRAVKIENELRYAVARGQLHAVYQPIVDLETGVMTSVEALLRWTHPELGQVSPAVFIPLAEKSGVRLTYLPLILAAVSIALGEHPHLNATVDPQSGDLLVHRDHDLSVAVDTEDGLVVPVIRAVQQRNLLDLAAEIERLSTAARSGEAFRRSRSSA